MHRVDFCLGWHHRCQPNCKVLAQRLPDLQHQRHGRSLPLARPRLPATEVRVPAFVALVASCSRVLVLWSLGCWVAERVGLARSGSWPGTQLKRGVRFGQQKSREQEMRGP